MRATWAVQSNKVRSTQTLPFIQALEREGEPWKEVAIDFEGDFIFDHGIETNNVIPIGSVTLVKAAERVGWRHIFTNNDFRVDIWNKKHPRMLNCFVHIDTLSSMKEDIDHVYNDSRDKKLFIRPLHDFKAFSGMVQTIDEFVEWVGRLQQTQCDLNPDTTYCIVSTVKPIEAEWRYFVVNGKIVTGSMYRFKGDTRVQNEEDPDVLAEAQMLADMWIPHPVCVMDVALSDGEAKVIEFNSFNASGIYDHDVDAIVKSVSEFVDLHGGFIDRRHITNE